MELDLCTCEHPPVSISVMLLVGLFAIYIALDSQLAAAVVGKKLGLSSYRYPWQRARVSPSLKETAPAKE